MDFHEGCAEDDSMSVVTLVSGGLDSTVMAALVRQEGVTQYPLFVNYGQLNLKREWNACVQNFRKHGLPRPQKMDLGGFGNTVKSGLTSKKLDAVIDAFLPTRNLLFLICGAAVAQKNNADAVLIGLLSERTHLFPDQTDQFLELARKAIAESLGRPMEIRAPLRQFMKQDVVQLAEKMRIRGTYSCHRGGARPCRTCIACREFVVGTT